MRSKILIVFIIAGIFSILVYNGTIVFHFNDNYEPKSEEENKKEDNTLPPGTKRTIVEFFAYSVNDESCYEEYCTKMKDFSDKSCLKANNQNCKDSEKYEVTLEASVTGVAPKEYKIHTDGRYTQVGESDTYIYAKIDEGRLLLGFAK